jgi:wobble nucleotide-excising tRNase
VVVRIVSGYILHNETAKKYKAQLTVLENDLKRKTSDYFNNIPVTEIVLITFKEDFEVIEKSVKAHNVWLDEFDENKKKALGKILKHYVAEYLQTEDYNQKETDKNQAETIISNLNSKITVNKADKLDFETQLKSSVKGQEELNDILEILLHRKDIRIEIPYDKFTLERSGHPANNLSEGEKSAIAFAYFLTELKALRNDDPPKLPNTIVFIDDPISSLDSNHIFQVRLLLHNFFKVNDFAQLFISTHNFEFFSVMLDTRLFGTIKKDTNENKRPLYFIKRNDDNTALIKKLPSSFSSYKSEYVGLFHTIKEFNDLADKEDFPNLLILPNAVRRFLELYTLMKYPSDTEVDNRVKQVFNPEDKPTYNTKLLHWFSHQNQFEKVQQHDDKLLQIDDAIKELMEHIETKDELHWKGLNGE